MKRVIILGLLLLTVGGMIGYRLIQNKNKQEKEPKTWHLGRQDNNKRRF